MASTQQTSTTQRKVTPEAESGNWVAVIIDGTIPPDSWQAAQPFVVAQASAPITSDPWEIRISGPERIETNYEIGGLVSGNARVYVYDVKNSPVALRDFCAEVLVPAAGQPPTCGFGFPSQPPPCAMQAVVMMSGAATGYLPDQTYAVSNTYPCPDPGPCFICWVADPVDSMAGGFSESFVDESIPGRGYGLRLTRRYDSNYSTVPGWFGFGWSSNYDMHASVDHIASGSGGTLDRVTISRGGGPQTVFVEKPRGGFTTQAGLYQGIERDQGGWTLTDWKAQMAWTFDSTGALTHIVDRNGEDTQVSYNSANKKITVTDSSTRTLVFTFNGPLNDQGSRVTSVTDPLGRTRAYTYETDGDLDTATDASGVASSFDYAATAAGDPHLLTLRTSGKGGSTTNTYQQVGLGAGAIYRVKTQTQKVNAAKPVRTTTFAYSGAPMSSGGGSTTVTDDHGVSTKYS